VREFLAKNQKWSDTTKNMATAIYSSFLKHLYHMETAKISSGR
jgi:hypothetical protein